MVPRVGSYWRRGKVLFYRREDLTDLPPGTGTTKVLWAVSRSYHASTSITGEEVHRHTPMRFTYTEGEERATAATLAHPKRSSFAFPGLVHVDGPGCFAIVVRGEGFRYKFRIAVKIVA